MTARSPSKQVRPTGKKRVRPGREPANRSAGPAGRSNRSADSSANQSDRRANRATDRLGSWPADVLANWSALPSRLRVALGIALGGGVLFAVGPLLPVVRPVMPPGFASGPLMVVLGLLPVGVALVLAGRGSVPAARGALLAVALFAPGRAIADAQLAVQGSIAARPELVMPTALLQLHGATGLWLLLAGEVFVLAGGLLAIGTGDTELAARELASATGESRPAIHGPGSEARQSGAPARESESAASGPGSAAGQSESTAHQPELASRESGLSVRQSGRTSGGYQGPVLIALGLGVVVALGLMAVPFTSSTPFVLANGVLDAPIMAMAGGLLIAVAAPLAATIALTSADPAAARGWLLGGQAVVLAIALPRVVSGLAVAGLHPSWGPYVAVVAALLLVGLGLGTERVIRPAPDDAGTTEPAELRLPGQSRLHVATGVLGLVAAGAALVGADTNLYVLSADLPRNTDVAGRLLVPAAVLLGVCAIGMLIPRWASVVRPAFAVAWVSVLFAGFGAVDTAMTATQIDGVRIGVGTWATGAAMLVALAAAGTAGLAGGVERDDVDLTELSWRPKVLVPAAAAAALAIGAFGLPVLRSDGFHPPGIWSDFRFASWGPVFSLVAVLAAALLAPICRPARAVGLLLGAAGLVLVRLLSLPLDRSMAPGVGAGPGMLIAVACLVALLVAAGMAGWLARGEAAKSEALKGEAVRPGRVGARRR